MPDPLGLITPVGRTSPMVSPERTAAVDPARSFKDVLKSGIEEVNRAQQDATRAVEGLATGERTDLEGVVLATQKADNAFRMLQALRNKVVEAYDEIKQMRV